MTFEAREIQSGPAVFRDGTYMRPEDADLLLIQLRRSAMAGDWWGEMANQMADDLAAAMNGTVVPRQRDKS